MHDKEIQYFTKALQQARDEFYLDAIGEFRKLIEEFPSSELADDAYFNIGLCYFNMNQFGEAIDMYRTVIEQYPEATISILDGGNEFGRTAAKCHYAILNCQLGLGNIDSAKQQINDLESFDSDSYILVDGKKTPFKELGLNALSIYEKSLNT
jgi:tetratricopeptide (TPR) repeat protein